MPDKNEVLLQKIQAMRTISYGCSATMSALACFPEYLRSMNFLNGEIDSVELSDGRLFKRGMLVHVSSTYTGKCAGVIISFSFGTPQLPVQVSMGGAEGELVASLDPHEITLLPKQSEMKKTYRVQVGSSS